MGRRGKRRESLLGLSAGADAPVPGSDRLLPERMWWECGTAKGNLERSCHLAPHPVRGCTETAPYKYKQASSLDGQAFDTIKLSECG